MLRNHSLLHAILKNSYTNQHLYDEVLGRYKNIQNAFHRSAARRSDTPNSALVVGYMCKWAFGLLKIDRGSIGLDFRHLLCQYRVVFGNCEPRCLPSKDGFSQQCEGSSPLKCKRFAGMKIEDQSAHMRRCNCRCLRLHWNESSYRSTKGGRAVSVVQENDGCLRHCAASEKTIAISHMWSHGQGGRPEHGETGLNQCLHERYCQIAQGHKCDSYWMDTPSVLPTINRFDWKFNQSERQSNQSNTRSDIN